jgi:hypothetical protein
MRPKEASAARLVPSRAQSERPRGEAKEIKLARAPPIFCFSFLYEQRKQSTLPLKAFSNREPLRAMLHDDENRLC